MVCIKSLLLVWGKVKGASDVIHQKMQRGKQLISGFVLRQSSRCLREARLYFSKTRHPTLEGLTCTLEKIKDFPFVLLILRDQ